jgi:hypothetical protein
MQRLFLGTETTRVKDHPLAVEDQEAGETLRVKGNPLADAASFYSSFDGLF